MTTTYVDNILDIFDGASDECVNEGMYWYHHANAEAWRLDYRMPSRGAGVLAVLSPLLSWPKNVEYANLVYAGATKIPCLTKNANKAIAIFRGENPFNVVSGVKVTSFYNNILNPYYDGDKWVTIDTHAYGIATRVKGNPKRSEYRDFVDAYVIAAAEAGITPMQMQAVTWIAWRKIPRNSRFV